MKIEYPYDTIEVWLRVRSESKEDKKVTCRNMEHVIGKGKSKVPDDSYAAL